MAARQAIRDVGRALDMPYDSVDEIAKAIPFNAVDPVDIGRALKRSRKFANATNRTAQFAN